MEFTEIALEQIERGIVLNFNTNLNTQIDAQNTAWSQRDQDFFTALNRPVLSISAEHVQSGNLYYGHIPSLIDAPIDKYPNVSVMAFNSIPIAGEDDEMEEYAIRVAIEVIVKSDAATTDKYDVADDNLALVVNSRLKRTVSAVRQCLSTPTGRNVGGIVPKFGNTPIINVGDVWAAKTDRGHQARFFWQGARLEYRINQWIKFG